MPVLLSGLLISCGDDDNKEPDVEKDGVAVKTVFLTSSVDIAERPGWEFWVAGYTYNYSITDKGIEATPKDKPYRFDSQYEAGGHVGEGIGPVIEFVSPDYYPVSKSIGPEPPRIGDQSTPEKLLLADKLSRYYSGTVTENLTNVDLIHSNALLDFQLVDMPAGADVRVGSITLITPYKESENHYKAIVLAEGGEFQAYITVKIEGETYTAYPTEAHMRRDTHYTFTVKFNPEKQNLYIEDLKQSVWSEE